MFEISSYKLSPSPPFLPEKEKEASIGNVKGKGKAFPNRLRILKREMEF
jgi:hypothetical protein